MANFFAVTLDTTGPSSPSISLAGGATYATAQLITAALGVGDGVTTGYQMKIWGDVDTAYDANIKASEGASAWFTYATSKQIQLSAGDGVKTIYAKFRDDVYNESAQASDTITMDTTVPVVTLTGPTVNKISKQVGKNSFQGSFTVDGTYEEYKVKVVPASGSDHTAGAVIPTAGGSSNTSGNAGGYNGATPVTITVTGTDLENASSGDGSKIIKVFVRDGANNWSV